MKQSLGKSLIALSASLVLVGLLLPMQAEAQGRYRGKRYSKSDVDRIIKRVETNSDEFKDAFDKALDRSRLDGSSLEDQLNRQVKQFESELDDLRDEFDKHDSWWETRDNVQEVRRQADEVNRLMRNVRMGAGVEAKWIAVRVDLNKLLGIYNLPLLKGVS